MSAESHRIPVDEGDLESLSAMIDAPSGPPRSAVLLAHGAGANMESAFLAGIAPRLATRGFFVLRFDYPYMERKRRDGRRRPPDRAETLERVHARALAELAALQPGRRWISAGKSLGGRMASRIAARGTDDGRTAGLVLLGYPLHPAGKPEKLRSEHFQALAEPALFLQGTRDRLCDLALLDRELQRYGGRATVSIVVGADHDFAVPRKSGLARDDVLDDLAGRIDDWERATFPD